MFVRGARVLAVFRSCSISFLVFIDKRV
jgi:hypothetical protein